MRNMQALYARYRYQVGAITPVVMGQIQESALATVRSALKSMETVLSQACFSRPDAPTQEGITAYALALMQLRESASAVGFMRLSNACDALAVTVARLIENRAPARPDQCETLRQFVTHARAMLELEMAGQRAHEACLLSDRGTPEPSLRNAH